METVVTGWGELRVGPYWALTRIVPGLVGEVGCGRGQALVWRGRLEQEEFLKKKKCKKRHSATVWGILLQQPFWPPPHPAMRCSTLWHRRPLRAHT